MATLASMKQAQQQNTNVTAQAANHPIIGKTSYLDKRKDLLGAGIPSHMTVEREIRTATVMLMQSRDLQAATPESFYTAVSVAVNSGIGLGLGKGYLVAYQGKCSYVPGWKGLVDLVSRTGRATVWTGIIHKGDHFEYALGDSPFLTHRPGDNENHKDITHYYAVGRVKGSEWPIIEVWSAAKVTKHLVDYNKVGGKHYALKDDNNMEMYGRKVVLLQAIKYLPQSQELETAIAADMAHETGKEMTIDGNFVYVNDDPQDKTGPDQTDDVVDASYDSRARPDPAPAAQPIRRAAEPVNPPAQPEQTQTAKLKHRLRTMTDIDALDAEATLIRDIASDKQEADDMNEMYHARRLELENLKEAAPAARRARPPMDLE